MTRNVTDTFRLMSNESLRFYAYSDKVRSAWKRAAAREELRKRDLVAGLGEDEARRMGA